VKDEVPLGEPSDTETSVREKISAAAPPAAPSLPADDCDLLYGVATIARWLGMTRAQAKPLIEADLIPTFRPPGRTVRCALKSALNASFRDWAKRR